MVNNRACLFLRVSSKQQDYSRQLADLKRYCKQQGYKVVKVIANKVTGRKVTEEREDLQQLQQLAKQRSFDKVIVTEITRIGRNAKDIRHNIDFLHALKIPVVFHNLGGLESLDNKGKESFVMNIIIAIHAELAQEEALRLSQRIRSGQRHAVSKGKKIGRPKGEMTAKDLLEKYPAVVTSLKKGRSLTECQRIHSVSRNTVIKVKEALNGHHS